MAAITFCCYVINVFYISEGLHYCTLVQTQFPYSCVALRNSNFIINKIEEIQKLIQSQSLPGQVRPGGSETFFVL